MSKIRTSDAPERDLGFQNIGARSSGIGRWLPRQADAAAVDDNLRLRWSARQPEAVDSYSWACRTPAGRGRESRTRRYCPRHTQLALRPWLSRNPKPPDTARSPSFPPLTPLSPSRPSVAVLTASPSPSEWR